jgi:hypothetical protein
LGAWGESESIYIPCHECGNSNCDCSPSEAD